MKLPPRVAVWTCAGALLVACLTLGCRKTYEDEAKLAGKTTADFPQITADVFKPMDGGIELSPEEIMGRNAWNLWSAGNEHFWNQVDLCDAQGGGFRVATRDFADDDCGDEHFEVVAAKFPPLRGGCLVSGEPDVLARACDEIAGDGRFQVKARLH